MINIRKKKEKDAKIQQMFNYFVKYLKSVFESLYITG